MTKCTADRYLNIAVIGAVFVLMGCLAAVATYFSHNRGREIRERRIVPEGVVADAATPNARTQRKRDGEYQTTVSFTTSAGEMRTATAPNDADRRPFIGETIVVAYNPDNSLGLRRDQPVARESADRNASVFSALAAGLIFVGSVLFWFGYRRHELETAQHETRGNTS